jgi:hypothetical protein
MWGFLKCLFLFLGIAWRSHDNYCVLVHVLFLFWVPTHRIQGHVRLSTPRPLEYIPNFPCVLPSCHPPPRHHAVFKAFHSPRLRPSSHSDSSRLSYRAPIPLRSGPPELTRTRAQRHVWSGRQWRSVLYQYHSGRKAVLRLNRYGQVRL